MMKTRDESTEITKEPKYLIFIAMTYILVVITAMTLTPRVLGLHIPFTQHVLPLPGGLFIFPIIYILDDIMAEVYGFARSRKVIWFATFCCFLYLLMTQLSIHLPEPSYTHTTENYLVVFNGIVPVFIGTIIGLVIGSFINNYLISKLKVTFGGKKFWIRAIASTAVGEAVVGAIGGTIAFFSTLGFSWHLVEIIVVTYIFNLLYEAFAMPLIVLLVMLLKKYETMDVYDFSVNYNPFRMKVE